MPLSRMLTWKEQAEDTSEQKESLEIQILETYNELEPFEARGWEKVEEMLQEEQRLAFRDIMNAEGEHILLARERAKLIAKLLQKKTDLRDQLSRLQKERQALEE